MPFRLNDYVQITDATSQSPVIIHAPHGGTLLPPGVREQFTIGSHELEAEHHELVDHATDTIARQALSQAKASAVINRLSRLVVDVERFDDPSEEKNAVGMGVLYTHGSRRQRLRDLPADVSDLKRFFVDYSEAVTHLVERALAVHGRAVVLDVHSYPSQPQLHELHTDEPPPPLCVGFETFHCTPELRELVGRSFAAFRQGDNQTFHGAYVPLKYYLAEPRVQSVMLEIRRDQYMDESRTVIDPARVSQLGACLSDVVRKVQ